VAQPPHDLPVVVFLDRDAAHAFARELKAILRESGALAALRASA